jgi:hypothetical protein
MRRPGVRQVLTVVVVAILALGLTATAVGYWTGGGSGSASTTLDNPQELIITAGTPSNRIYPGGQAAVALVAENPNPYTVHISSLALDASQGTGGFGVDAGHAGCGVSTLTFATQTNGGAGWTVPAKSGSVNGSLSIALANALSMGVGAADACQGADFTIHVLANP